MEWVRIRHPELDLEAKVAYKAWKFVHALPENGGWLLADPVDDGEEE